MTVNISDIKVLAFDVFGTVVDWHGSIAAEVRQLYPQVDGEAFALAWREGYQPAMQRVRPVQRTLARSSSSIHSLSWSA